MKKGAEDLPSRRLFQVEWAALSNVELLALLLAPGSNEHDSLRLARRLIGNFGSLGRLAQAGQQDLLGCGLSRKRALALSSAVELTRRLQSEPLRPGESFRSSRQIFRHFQWLAAAARESFWSTLLDGKNRIRRILRISEGSLTSSIVHPREVFRPAIHEGAVGILCVHNHPSGDPAPSAEDVEVTRRLKETGRIVGIRLLDHVIIGRRCYFSFADEGLL